MTPEGEVRAYLKKRVKELGGTHRKLQWIVRVGAPDEVAWWPGPVLGFFECKRPKGGRLSAPQEREIGRMREAGFNVYLTHTKESVDAALEDLLRGR